MMTDLMRETTAPAGQTSQSGSNLHVGAAQHQAFDAGELSMQADGDTLIVVGDVDLYEAPRFRTVAEEHIFNVEAPRFDMIGVAFLDSAGLATLLYLSRKAAGMHKALRIKIIGGPRRVLRITGIDRMLSVED